MKHHKFFASHCKLPWSPIDNEISFVCYYESATKYQFYPANVSIPYFFKLLDLV